MMGEAEYLVDRMRWFADVQGLDDATVREIVEAVIAEQPNSDMNDKITDVRWRLMRADRSNNLKIHRFRSRRKSLLFGSKH